jgi:hypothetical protein
MQCEDLKGSGLMKEENKNKLLRGDQTNSLIKEKVLKE